MLRWTWEWCKSKLIAGYRQFSLTPNIGVKCGAQFRHVDACDACEYQPEFDPAFCGQLYLSFSCPWPSSIKYEVGEVRRSVQRPCVTNPRWARQRNRPKRMGRMGRKWPRQMGRAIPWRSRQCNCYRSYFLQEEKKNLPLPLPLPLPLILHLNCQIGLIWLVVSQATSSQLECFQDLVHELVNNLDLGWWKTMTARVGVCSAPWKAQRIRPITIVMILVFFFEDTRSTIAMPRWDT